MSLLHPYYLIAIVYILFFSIQEVFVKKVDKKWFWLLGIYLIIIVGLRDNVGPDYGSYKGIYIYSDTKDYISIIRKALHMQGAENVDIEWLYALINKILLNVFNAPFYVVTLVVAIFAIFFKIEYTEDNTFSLLPTRSLCLSLIFLLEKVDRSGKTWEPLLFILP